MDGTLYLGNRLFKDTIEFLEKIKSNGARYIFLTNNSSKGTDKYIQKLSSFGIHSSENDFLTSTDATIAYIKRGYPNTRFYCMGTESFVSQLKSAGVKIATDGTIDVDGVVISNDTELTFEKLDNVSRILSNGNPIYIATNPDWTCPTEYGFVPDCGSFADILYRATGKTPYFIGKPNPDMINLAMDKFGYSKEETVIIGDRIYTDIAAGINAGVDSVLVLSGESTLDDLKSSEIKPSYVFDSITNVKNII